MLTLEDIRAARVRVGDAVRRTPCELSEPLSRRIQGSARLKLESLQHTGSFKARGALNRLLTLSDAEKRSGVIAASAGNHAQGVAYHATRLGIRSLIVMPVGTPLIKVARTQGYGATVKLHGENYDEAFDEAKRIAALEGYTYVHAYDDKEIMAGQGTLGFELLEQVPDLDVVVIPIGGGGLMAGTATVLKALRPQVRVVGVEAAVLPSMKRAIEEGKPIKLPAARTLAEGIAVRQVGAQCAEVCARVVDEIVTVEDDEIARAILFLLETEKTVAEGAGAAGVAALLSGRIEGLAGKSVCAVVCGGNIDVNMLGRIIERGLVESGRLLRFHISVPDRPGSLADLLLEVARLSANVVEVHHDRAFARGSLGHVQVQLVVETRGHEHAEELLRALEQKGYARPL